MGMLAEAGFDVVNHYAPVHYLPFIARYARLSSKPELRRLGFVESHFRSKSRSQDEIRGFGGYSHSTLHPLPPILRAKLNGGFPHFRLAIPVSAVESGPFDLCRFNVAMTRYLRRGDKLGHRESEINGRYYGKREIPVARTISDRVAMLAHARKRQEMIEVLVSGGIDLPANTRVVCFNRADAETATGILRVLGRDWNVVLDRSIDYSPNSEYAEKVATFVRHALDDPNWRGDGLEFDRV